MLIYSSGNWSWHTQSVKSFLLKLKLMIYRNSNIRKNVPQLGSIVLVAAHLNFSSKTRNIYLTITITILPGREKNGIMDIELLYHVFFRTCVYENNVKLIISGIAQSRALVN